MTKRLDIKTGDRFGRYTVIKELDKIITKKGGHVRVFECRCDCGNIRNEVEAMNEETKQESLLDGDFSCETTEERE